ncbi:alpha/beta hydrolase fold protein [Nocardioides sp. CF8]|uniref:alpha/beta fold hydrolase n=1 Tax=Nocardioides sp. CF8 TaxID=110319 RepID=UPI00032DD578|nr:alpha/beta hydrolase [Nocardioides sp. CF8]EON25215.1 alpha/beta hydrolase fold protein [Nocardioides sp. CF8]
MSITRRLIGAAAGIAAAGMAVGVAQRSRVIARRGAGDETPFGSLRSEPLHIITDDATDLYAEIDEAPSELTVIFAHGYSLNLDCWHFQRAGYRGQIRTVFYDQRSHGRSARSSEAGSTIEQLGSDLRRVIEQTSPGPCVLIGHSMGGMSIVSLAEQHPELFGDKVVGVGLISTTAGGLDPGRILFPMVPLGIGGKVMSRTVRTLHLGHRAVDLVRKWGHAFADVITERYAFGDDVPGHYVDFVYDMLDATPFSVVADFYPAFATLDKFDHVEVLGRVPTAVICGTEDKITTIGHARKLHAQIPGSSLLECEGAGHMVILERHVDVNAELDDLIALAQHGPEAS